MGSERRTKLEEIFVAIIFIVLMIASICFSMNKSHATSVDAPQSHETGKAIVTSK